MLAGFYYASPPASCQLSAYIAGRVTSTGVRIVIVTFAGSRKARVVGVHVAASSVTIVRGIIQRQPYGHWVLSEHARL